MTAPAQYGRTRCMLEAMGSDRSSTTGQHEESECFKVNSQGFVIFAATQWQGEMPII